MPVFDQSLLNTLVAKQLAQDKERARFESPPPEVGPQTHPISPMQSMFLGAGLDGLSTYGALKNGHSEGNSMWQGMSPAATGLAVGLIGPALHYGLGKLSPKAADLVSSQMGARQTALGSENLYGSHNDQSSDDRVNQKLDPAAKIR